MQVPHNPPHATNPTVGEVIERMGALSATLPEHDGVRAFNAMYLLTTRQVERAIAALEFSDAAFISRLDVVFAGLYFDALETWTVDPARAPRCWRALFDCRSRRGIHPLQFAIAGMNAHINHDLALAVVTTVAEFGGRLDAPGPWRADYFAVNAVLARTQPLVKAELLSEFAAWDEALGDVDDRVGLWGIERAREFAWSTAGALWVVRETPLAAPLVDAVDGAVALTSKLLLNPVAL